MTVLKILAVLAVLAFLVFSSVALNEYSEKRYNYKPFSIGNTAAMALAVILLAVSVFVVPEGQTIDAVILNAVHLQFSEASSNSVALVAISALIATGAYIHLIAKTNIFVATFAIFVQFIAAVAIVVILVLLALGADKKRRRRRS